MLIGKDVAVELACSSVGDDFEGFKVIKNELVDHSRWSLRYSLVVEKDGHYYRSGYSRGATESQDEGPYEYDGEQIEFVETYPKEVTITVYE